MTDKQIEIIVAECAVINSALQWLIQNEFAKIEDDDNVRREILGEMNVILGDYVENANTLANLYGEYKERRDGE